jgi:hypothetical protein
LWSEVCGVELKKSQLSGDHNLLSKSNIDKNIIKEAFKSCNHPNRVTLKTEFGSSPTKGRDGLRWQRLTFELFRGII